MTVKVVTEKETNGLMGWVEGIPTESVEVLAESIHRIAKAMDEIEKSRLNRKALVTLVHAHSGVGKRDIEIILNCLQQLEEIYLKPPF